MHMDFLCRAFIPYLSCAGFPSENMWKSVVMQIMTGLDQLACQHRPVNILFTSRQLMATAYH